MIERDEPHDVVADHLLLVVVQAIDARDVQADAGEDGFPTCLAIRADHGVRRREFVADV